MVGFVMAGFFSLRLIFSPPSSKLYYSFLVFGVVIGVFGGLIGV